MINIMLEELIKQIKENSELEKYLFEECDVEFEDKETLEYDLNLLLEGGICNYKLLPFANTGSGGIYALLDNNMVGYIDSEGGASIIAKNIKDFFSIVISCGYVGDYGYCRIDYLKDKKKFIEEFNKRINYKEEKDIKEFIINNKLETNSEIIYNKFKDAVITEPKLLIKAISDDYEDSDQIFKL